MWSAGIVKFATKYISQNAYNIKSVVFINYSSVIRSVLRDFQRRNEDEVREDYAAFSNLNYLTSMFATMICLLCSKLRHRHTHTHTLTVVLIKIGTRKIHIVAVKTREHVSW